MLIAAESTAAPREMPTANLNSITDKYREAVLPAATIFLLPLLVIGLTPNLMLQKGWLDPYVYSGYIHDYRRLFEYFGATYYSNRVATIDVSRVVMSLLGTDRGYFAVRYVLLALASASIYTTARRFYPAAVGVTAAVLLCFCPWYLRAIAYDYVDGFAITYLLAAFALLIAPRRHRFVGHALAGVFFAFAVNSNFYTVAIAGSFVPSWFLLQRRNAGHQTLLLMAAVVAGFLGAYLTLGLVLHAEFNRPIFFERATINVINQLLIQGESAQYFQPLIDFIAARHYYVFVPLILCAAILGVWFQTKPRRVTVDEFVTSAAVYMSVVTVVYLVNHFVLHHGRITLVYYFSYSMIASYLVVIALLGEMAARVQPRHQLMALAGSGLVYVAIYCAYSFWYSGAVHDANVPLYLWAVATFGLLLSASVLHRPVLRLLLLLPGLVAIPVPFYHSAEEEYGLLHSRSAAMEQWDVYHSSLYLQRALGSVLDPHNGPIKFWYSVSLPDHRPLNSVQSMYLWGYSRIAGMPIVPTDLERRLEGARYLVLLGLSAEEIETALVALSNAGVHYNIVHHDHFDSATWSMRFVVLDLGKRRPLSPALYGQR